MAINEAMFLLVGESGSGKTTVLDRLRDEYRLNKIRNYTTREPRASELNGNSDYTHLTEEEFMEKLNTGELIQHATHNGHHYGVPIPTEKIGVLIVNPDGHDQIRKYCEINKIKICAICLEVSGAVARQRMLKRGDDEDAVERRLAFDKTVFTEKAKKRCDIILNGNDSEDEVYKYVSLIFKAFAEDLL